MAVGRHAASAPPAKRQRQGQGSDALTLLALLLLVLSERGTLMVKSVVVVDACSAPFTISHTEQAVRGLVDLWFSQPSRGHTRHHRGSGATDPAQQFVSLQARCAAFLHDGVRTEGRHLGRSAMHSEVWDMVVDGAAIRTAVGAELNRAGVALHDVPLRLRQARSVLVHPASWEAVQSGRPFVLPASLLRQLGMSSIIGSQDSIRAFSPGLTGVTG